MALKDVLQPKSPTELEDLKRRGFRQTEGKWKFLINIKPLLDVYEEDEDTEDFRQGLIELLSGYEDDIALYLNDDDRAIMDFEDIINELRMLDEYPEESEIDYVLEMLYDFGDNYDVWINNMIDEEDM